MHDEDCLAVRVAGEAALSAVRDWSKTKPHIDIAFDETDDGGTLVRFPLDHPPPTRPREDLEAFLTKRQIGFDVVLVVDREE